MRILSVHIRYQLAKMAPLCFLKACPVGLWLQRFPSQSRYHAQYGQCILDRPVCTTEIVERNLSGHKHISEVLTAVVSSHQYKPIDYKNNVQKTSVTTAGAVEL